MEEKARNTQEEIKAEEKVFEPAKEVAAEAGIVKWQAPEYEHVERTTTWYWISIAIAVLLVGIALSQKNFLFAILVVIAELTIFRFSNEKPKVWDFRIDRQGITIEEHKTYKFKDIALFDIHPFSDKYYELVLHPKGKMSQYLKMFIPVDHEDRIKKALKENVKHGEIEPSLIDILERWIGF